ncbi:LANO_0B04676g1_1 [Lachancea nothofagi CBS 11611]|uniref:LANO_0B04676g1_1 n=1 Tax=Lachancea nothofagi CBS 11611 TaxID=1266666 RepID=A0A1G4IXY2_9SACH|nr:LANO_0B04676g1_1 [Lachancea nothofagi CBS 11611]
MTHLERIDGLASRLKNDDDCANSLSTVSEICDIVEPIGSSTDYEQFLKAVMPILLERLESTPISLDGGSPMHKLRNSILEVLNRCNMNEVFEPYALDNLTGMLAVLQEDNEENGVLAMRIITGYFKAYKPALQDRVTAFIDVIMNIYKHMPELVRQTFNDELHRDESVASMDSTNNTLDERALDANEEDNRASESLTAVYKPLKQSMFSFKVLSECPITMVTLYSSYKQLTTASLPQFMPLIIELLTMEADAQKRTREEAESRGDRWINVSPEIKNRVAYCDFILSQIKATSFLAYVFIRGYAAEYLQNYVGFVPDLILRLLQDCPAELSAARKELLHATRHILSTNYKKLFLSKINLLFDERVLIGNGFTAHETLRPLAYSTVADFVHNVRGDLQLDDIEKTIKMYTNFLLDESLALTVQIMSAKLLLNLVERILKLGKENPNDSVRSKKLLIVIIDAYTVRFRNLNRQYDNLMQHHEEYEREKLSKTESFREELEKSNKDTESFIDSMLKVKQQPAENKDSEGDVKMENAMEDEPEFKISRVKGETDDRVSMEDNIDVFDIKFKSPILLSPPPNSDPLKDAFYLYRTLMSFLKTIIHDLKVFNPPSTEYTTMNPKVWTSLSRIFSHEEVIVFKNLFHECILGLQFFSSPERKAIVEKKHFDIAAPSLPVSATKDGRELMDYFAIMFMQIDSPTFNDIVESKIDFLYEAMLRDSALLHVAQSFLTSEITSPKFTGILLRFLKQKFSSLGNVDGNKSNILIRLFKLSFMSVNLFPITNEIVLLPHLNKLILDSLKYSTTAEEPLVYLYLIRTLFRSIGGGRFENLYRSIKPILQVLLQSLNRMILTARRPHERDLYVELCLTVPVRLSVLAPYLSYLMKPLVYALQGFPELVTQGLRTLELCIDNLTAEYFDPIIEPVVEDVIRSLFKLLKPQPFNHQISHTAVRILGKLGGRNRRFLKQHSDLRIAAELDTPVNALFKIQGINEEVPLSITPGVRSALEILEDYRSDLFYKKSAFNYLKSILQLFLKSSLIFPDNYDKWIKSALHVLAEENVSAIDSTDVGEGKIKDRRLLQSQELLLMKLLESLIFSASIEDLREDAESILKNVINHFCFLQLNNSLRRKRGETSGFSVNVKLFKVTIDVDIILDAILTGLGSYLEESRRMAVAAVKQIFDTSNRIYGAELALKYSFISTLTKKFIHKCYDEAYFEKSSGVLGIKTLVEEHRIPVEYLKECQFDLIAGLLFVLIDTPMEAPGVIRERAEKLITSILASTCKNIREEDLHEKGLQNTLIDIVCELSNAKEVVRSACQNALATISEVSDIPIVKLMEHSKSFLLSPIFAKPLRALPFPMQIGNVDAIIYCLQLPNTFLEFNEELYRLLHEAIALVDAEDESLASAQRVTEYQTAEQLVQLRVVCIKLLSLALKNGDFASAQQGATRIRVLAVFFKTMLKTSPEIIEATYQGLKSVLAENSKLPKELLQNGLKPMLMNLSDHQKLTVSGLEALAKLLELLIAYFKVEIGKKLLDHLDAWCRVEVLDMIFGKDLKEQTPTKIIYGIINIFHLLPPQADIFLNDLLLKVMLVEKKLRLQLDSPFREPMAKYLNRFHSSVIAYFNNNLGSRDLVLLMCSIIKRKEAVDLKNDFKQEFHNFCDYYMTGISSNKVRVVSFFANVVDIFDSLVHVESDDWLADSGPTLIKVRGMLKLAVDTVDEGDFHFDSLQLSQASDKIQTLYAKFLELNVNDPTLLFEYLEFAFTAKINLSQSILAFIEKCVITTDDVENKKIFLQQALLFCTRDKPLAASVFVLKHVINSTLVYEGSSKGSLKRLTGTEEHGLPEWLNLMYAKIWKGSNEVLESYAAGEYDAFRFELLQLSSIFTEYDPDLNPDIRKDIIRFCWNFIKLEDPLLKQGAYMVTAYFIAKYEFPVKIVTQVFVALLRTTQIESRYMVKHSLDLLAPVMHDRMASAEAPNSWINWVRRVLSENNASQNGTLYQLLISHPHVFFDSRDLFIPSIINYIGKLTLLANPSIENQSLAIDLADLILTWEKKARNPKPSDASVKEDIEEIDETERQNITTAQKEAFVTCLIRYVCVSNHRASETELGSRSLKILSEIPSERSWPEVNIKLSYFEKFLVQQDLSSSNISFYCMNALDVLGIILRNKSPSWIIANLTVLQGLLDKCLRTDHHDIQDVLQKVLGIILASIKSEEDLAMESDVETPSKQMLNTLSSIITEDLQGTSSVAAGVMLAWTLFMYFPQYIDPLLPSIMKTFSKLCKDHLATSQPKDPATLEEARITTKLLEKVLYLLSMKVASLGDARRPFLSTVALLIDRSMNQQFLKKVITIARTWVFTNEIFPTVKEKAAILTKMLAFEVRGEPKLSRQFYEIILELFENKNFNNSEITVRMEQPFLVGTRVEDIYIRKRLMSILDDSLERDIRERLYYVIRDQNWEFIADYPWLNQALQLLYGAFDKEYSLKLCDAYQLDSLEAIVDDLTIEGIDEYQESSLTGLIEQHKEFAKHFGHISCNDILEPLVDIFYQSPQAIHSTWINVFGAAYRSIPKNEKFGFVRSLVTLLSKDYHARQLNVRSNVVSTLLDSISEIDSLELPPHLIKYVASSYNSWYQSIKILESLEERATLENANIIETNEDALLELYVNLQEEDMFYGLWRRRAKYTETSIALSFEQLGIWDKAQQLYEAAQVKARSGALPYSDSEYSAWEDNWIMCAEKLQHWDVLTELAKHEGFTDLLLECGWRVADWSADREALEQSVKSVMDVPTPRRQIFETFLALQNFAETKKGDQEVRRLCDEGIQLSLHKWASMPERFTPAHKFLLHGFQQYMEFLEATQVYANLASTTVQNLDTKAQEVKRVLQTWRDRLPNIWDDINMWNDLITWRQHAFQVINNAYLPLVPALQQASGNNNVNTHAYRGYHEIAWVINRFAHVARKHNMPDVCISQLARIYTLPNIEIQEAFLKLREQAKCHYQNMNELTTGLDVISNTNLVYFGTVQKAEFFTLKGMFLSKLRAHDEANQAFATAVQIDLNLAKAWAQWGFFNDRRLSEEPQNISFANNAISCYLQAAGLYNNSKTRKLLCRILWLIGIDDSTGTLASAFESFRGEIPVWYWITFIPQLLTSLSHKEANMVRQILIRIAKSYPQALHFQLRTTKEDFSVIQRQTMVAMNNARPPNSKAPTSTNGTRQPWEYLDELNGILKTAYPLLALSLESLVDQINQKFKTTSDEDLFRLINVLLIDGTYNFNRLPLPRENLLLPASTETNLVRFSENLLPPHIRVKFNADFIDSKPNFEEYIKRLRYWRNRLENKLDRAPKVENMEKWCPHLSNFHHQKFEDIEIPGQYLLNKDSNAHFVKIARFLPHVDFVRGTHSSYRRLTIRGHDGSLHSFAVQYPAVRHSRREERMFQLFRLFNETLSKNVQTRRRNIQFSLPIAVPLSPQVRIMNDSSTITTMHNLYDNYCDKNEMDRGAIQDFVCQQLDAAYDKILPPPDITAVKVEIFSSVQSMYLPTTVMKDYFTDLFTQFEDFWLFRKQFSSQYALFIFMTYMLAINNRSPHKISIDQVSGDVFTLEMLPARYPYERVKQTAKNFEANIPPDSPVFHNNEAVPFRLTPNIQKLIGDSALEGILSVNVFAVARALLEPDNELNTYLSLFIRDEVISWYSNLHRSIVGDPQLREIVRTNVDLITRKTAQLGHLSSKPSVATQYVLDAISAAVSPRNLAKMDQSFMPYF